MHRKIGRIEAIVTLALVGSDVWIIFTNQAIYLENTQLVLILFAIWTYWRATETTTSGRIHQYLLAGFLLGCVLSYKQLGGFLVLSVLANWFLQRRHFWGHIALLCMAFITFNVYLLVMHLSFGQLFDSATIVQIDRTIGFRSSAGLTYSPLTGLSAVVNVYWMFIVTVLVLVGGSILVLLRTFQHLFRKRQGNTVVLAWALGGIVFALSISLKSPHYMILWLVPLYVFLVQEGCLWARTHLVWLQREAWIVSVTVLLVMLNIWSYQARFFHIPGDTLLSTVTYINHTIPANSVVVTEDYIGVDIQAAYSNIRNTQTPQAIYANHADYLALYWSTTDPLPESLGAVTHYCHTLAIFNGFKDHAEVCQIDKAALQKLVVKANLP